MWLNRDLILFIYFVGIMFLINVVLFLKLKKILLGFFMLIFLDKESQYWLKVFCKSKKRDYIMKLRVKRLMDQLILCFIKVLQVLNDVFFWSVLGEFFQIL